MDSLDKWINEIDCIDDRIMSLFEKRMGFVRNSAEYKKKHGFKKDNKAHDADIKKKVKNDTDPELSAYAEELVKCLLNISNRYELRIMKQK